jgi:ribosomal protein S18 acetylase RimI-like enzyme
VTDTITIRLLGPDDVDVLDRVRPGTFAQDPDPVHAWAFLTTGVNATTVALSEGQVVGYATGIVIMHPNRPREFLVTDLGVHQEFRGRGLGTRLVERLRNVAAERGCESMAMLSESSNGGAQRVSEKLLGGETESVVRTTWDLTDL